VRAGAREPGGPLVECEPGRGDQAVIIEDVVASGGSAVRVIRALLAETSLRVAGVQSIVNWNFPEMRDLLAPWTVRAVTSYPQVLASAREAGLLSDADVCELLRFYADPRRHRWPSGPAVGAPLSGLIRSDLTATRISFSDYRKRWQHLLQFRNTYYSVPQHLLQITGQNDLIKRLLTAMTCHFTLLTTRVRISGTNNAYSMEEEAHTFAGSGCGQTISSRSEGKKWVLGYY
jgi:hypothetical protein